MKNKPPNYLTHNLRLLRVQADIPCVELSFRLNFHTGRAADIENSDKRQVAVRDDEIEAIARYFKVDTETLLYKKAYVAFE